MTMFHACAKCGKLEHLDDLDGRPPYDEPDAPDFTLVVCRDCYGEVHTSDGETLTWSPVDAAGYNDRHPDRKVPL